jgi:transposase
VREVAVHEIGRGASLPVASSGHDASAPAADADKGYDADWLRADLRKSGITPVIPGKRGRKRKIRPDKPRYRERWRIEATFNRHKDFRRIATRYDKLARNYASALALAAVIAFWC